jgi:hypothetical protein
MKASVKEFQSKLSLARAKLIDITLERFRQAEALGIKAELEILATSKCSVAEAQSGKTYSLENIPVLPILGCNSPHACGCCYSPVS